MLLTVPAADMMAMGMQMARQAKPGLPLPGSANGTRGSIMEYAVQLLLRLAQDSKQKGLTPFLPWEELQASNVCPAHLPL